MFFAWLDSFFDNFIITELKSKAEQEEKFSSRKFKLQLKGKAVQTSHLKARTNSIRLVLVKLQNNNSKSTVIFYEIKEITNK